MSAQIEVVAITTAGSPVSAWATVAELPSTTIAQPASAAIRRILKVRSILKMIE
jgi:hypothetical protein